MICPDAGTRMKAVVFLTDYAVVNWNIRHMGLTFQAEKPPPSHVFQLVAFIATEECGEDN